MKRTSLAAALLAALTLAGAASASPYRHHHHGHGHLRLAVRAHAGGSFLAAAATYIGVDEATLTAGLKAGQSLAQIATAHGKTADGLVQALVAPAKLRLDAAVAAGHLTADREGAILSRLTGAVTKLVNAAPPVRTPREHPVRVPVFAILKPALTYLGLDFRSLVMQLRSGKTLADVAVAQGKTAVGLVDAIVTSVKTTLDARVAAGRLSAADEATFLTQLQTNVTALVTGTHS